MIKYITIALMCVTIALHGQTEFSKANNLLITLKTLKQQGHDLGQRLDALDSEMKTVKKLNPEFSIADFMKEIRGICAYHAQKIESLESQAYKLESEYSVIKDVIGKVTKLDEYSAALKQGNEQAHAQLSTLMDGVIQRISELEKVTNAAKKMTPEVISQAIADKIEDISKRLGAVEKYILDVDTIIDDKIDKNNYMW